MGIAAGHRFAVTASAAYPMFLPALDVAELVLAARGEFLNNADTSASGILREYAAWNCRTHAGTGTRVCSSGSRGAIFGLIIAQPTI